jgi:predicted transcriptional regulator
MKLKTSVTLSSSTIAAIDELAGSDTPRSRMVEQAVLEYVERRRGQVREARDLKILNRAARHLNREIEDVLEFQTEL